MTGRVHVVVGSPWREAVLKHLEPRSAYRPWPEVPDVREGDGVLVVFDTEPRLVLAQLATVGPDRSIEAAMATLHRVWWFTNAVALPRLGVQMHGHYALVGDPSSLVRAVEEQRFNAPREDRFGHSSGAAARALLQSGGRCTGCGNVLDLVSSVPEVRTAEAEDWPAVLCSPCTKAMRDGGFDTFLSYRFSLQPPCPRCDARRTRRSQFGMPAVMFETVPWRLHQGCCVTPDEWTCSVCEYQW